MTSKKLAVFILAGVVGLVGLGIKDQLSMPTVNGLVSVAHAVVGRPLSPVSVAGVARRDARRQ
jgi:hypothetical protein